MRVLCRPNHHHNKWTTMMTRTLLLRSRGLARNAPNYSFKMEHRWMLWTHIIIMSSIAHCWLEYQLKWSDISPRKVIETGCILHWLNRYMCLKMYIQNFDFTFLHHSLLCLVPPSPFRLLFSLGLIHLLIAVIPKCATLYVPTG
jgi:hypothetical protein